MSQSRRQNGFTSFSKIAACIIFLFVSASCSFDYSTSQESEKNKPDIVMEKLEYVRMRGGNPLVRFTADYAERWEDRQTMELKNFLFEQMEDKGETVNIEGNAGAAEVDLDSGDIVLSNGVRIRIESEDLIISTATIEWKDSEKTFKGSSDGEVDIQRSDGTHFVGRGFSGDVRRRTWIFSGEARGSFVDEDDEENEDITE